MSVEQHEALVEIASGLNVLFHAGQDKSCSLQTIADLCHLLENKLMDIVDEIVVLE